jgi:hypothetical protein
MSWHVEEAVLHRYQIGTVDRVTGVSLEAHVTECVDCRGALMVDGDWLEQSWVGIADRVEPGSRTVVERVLTSVGVPSHLARVMAVTPSLRPSWLIAVTLTLLFAAMASSLMVQPGSFDLFLAVAPLIPVAGVAVAYGRVGDPAYEMTAAAPIDPLRLLLLRAAAVTGFALVLSLILDVIFSSTRATGLWILPALALTLTTLALGTQLAMMAAAAASAVGWVVVLTLFLVRGETRMESVFGLEAQLVSVVVAVAATFVFVHGRDVYRRGDEK